MSDTPQEDTARKKELLQLFWRVLGKIGTIQKNATNTYHNSRYATLDSVLEAIEGPLAEEGFRLSQPSTFDHSTQSMIVQTLLIHESGDILNLGNFALPIKDLTPQNGGTGQSYARRYSLYGHMALKVVDDDGNAASGFARRGPGNPAPAPRESVPMTDPEPVGNDGSFTHKGKTHQWLDLNPEKLGVIAYTGKGFAPELQTKAKQLLAKYAADTKSIYHDVAAQVINANTQGE